MDNLDRLYRRLDDAMHREHSGQTDQPVTIAEIYQHLVPYRAVRSELGFGELAEYEHTLLRLLSGERAYARVAIPQVQEDFQRELRAPNPILGLYRDYAAVEVSVTTSPAPDADTDAVSAAADVGAADEIDPDADNRTADESTAALPELPALSESKPPSRPAAAPDELQEDRTLEMRDATIAGTPEAKTAPRAPEPAADGVCRACHHSLPEVNGREVRFCPFCGEQQHPSPCIECGDLLEWEWRFCIRCGTSRHDARGDAIAGTARAAAP